MIVISNHIVNNNVLIRINIDRASSYNVTKISNDTTKISNNITIISTNGVISNDIFLG